MNNEIAEITTKIEALDAIRAKLEQGLLKLQEDELELDDECEYILALPIRLASHPALQWKEFRSEWSLRVPRTNPKQLQATTYLRVSDAGEGQRSCLQNITSCLLVLHSW
jgi:hypothetical protein